MSKSFDLNDGSSEGRVYLNAEEEVFKEFSDATIELYNNKERDGSQSFLEVLLLSVDKVNTAIDKIKELIK